VWGGVALSLVVSVNVVKIMFNIVCVTVHVDPHPTVYPDSTYT
jgi:hypothetical protein